ncbi:hypothetical protein GCM10009628_09510 [Paeniglutamicibacter kerguelensis]
MGQHIAAGRASRAGALVGHELDLDQPFLGKGIEVTTDCSRCEPKTLAQFSGADRAILKNGIQDSVAGAFFGLP